MSVVSANYHGAGPEESLCARLIREYAQGIEQEPERDHEQRQVADRPRHAPILEPSGNPYATLAQALQSLVRPLLGKSDPELAGWRDALQEALGPNAR